MAKVETERFFGKKGIIIMIRDGSKLVSAIFKDKKNADKFNRNNPSDVKKLLQLAKKTKYPKGIDEDTDVGHQDDEPNMLKSTTLEIMEYGKKLTDMLDKYDDMDGEVDFPNWWQKKLILARDYVSAAYHYLDSEEKTSENMDRNFRSYDDEEEVEEGFASNAQRKAAFASGYKAKGKKGKKKNESVNEDKFYNTRVQYTDPKNKKKFVGDVVRKDGDEYKVNLGKDGRFEKYILAKAKDLKIVSKSKKRTYESVNEAYVVLYSPKKGVKPVSTAAYKDKKDAEKWAKDLGGITMIVKKKVRYIDETKAQINKIKKQAGKKEIKFYDILSNIEKKLGKNKYRAFLVKSLKDFKINGNHYDYRSNAAAEEKLFQVSEVNTNEDLRNWFKSKWVNIGKKDKSGKHPPCGTSGNKKGYAKCVPAKKAASMSKKEKESATRRKRAAQNKSNRGGKSSAGQGKKPINVSTHTGGRKSGTGKGS